MAKKSFYRKVYIHKLYTGVIMANINQQIWKLLSGDTSIRRDLNRKIINIRALAKYLIAKYKLKASLDSVISAIRRYTLEPEFKEEESVNLFKDAEISTKNHIVCITLRKEGYKAVSKVLQLKDPVVSDTYRIITGAEHIRIIVSERNLDQVFGFFQRKSIVDINKNLSEISIVVSAGSRKTKGVLAKVANEIALNNINIEEVIICPPELFFYVHEEDAVKTHGILMKLQHQSV